MKHLILFIAAILITSSCNEKLDLVPVSSKTEANFYLTSQHIEQAILGCYNGLQVAKANHDFSYMLSESRSDNTWQIAGYEDNEFGRFSEDASSSTIASAWNNLYDYVDRCNKILNYLPDVTEEEGKKNLMRGEALFLRSLFYFDLVRIFGGVPLVTKPLSIEESYDIPKSSILEVYDLIKSDLSKIVNEQLLSKEIVPGRASLYSAMALLGKVLIYRSGYPLNSNEWSEARDVLSEVIQSGEFEFLDDYEDVFAHTNENGRQSVLSVKFTTENNEGNHFPSRNAPNEIDPADFIFGGSAHRLFITEDIVESIFPEQGDKRKSASLRLSWLNKGGDLVENDPWCHKYGEYKGEINGPVSGLQNWDIDFILIRYTDVLLLYAEAINENDGPTDEAMEILNMVRARAGLQAKQTSDADTFRLWMEQERRSEFCFENERWFDLVRTDRAIDVMPKFLEKQGGTFKNNFTDRSKYYFPIPQIVTDLTGIK